MYRFLSFRNQRIEYFENNPSTIVAKIAQIIIPFLSRCDVTDRAAVFKLQEKVSKEVGDVTILVNNAGIMPCKPLLRHTEKEIRSEVEINFIGNLWVRTLLLKYFQFYIKINMIFTRLRRNSPTRALFVDV